MAAPTTPVTQLLRLEETCAQCQESARKINVPYPTRETSIAKEEDQVVRKTSFFGP
jgi:hypothetical protein